MRDQTSSKNSVISDTLLDVLQRVSPRMHVINRCSMVLGVLLLVATAIILQMVVKAQMNTDQMNEAYRACQQAVDELQETSDFLTNEARQYVSTGEKQNLSHYLNEVERHDRRGHALETLRNEAMSDEAVAELEEARRLSDELAETELYALRLSAETHGLDPLPASLEQVELTTEDDTKTLDEKQELANELVYGADYNGIKFRILDQVHKSSEMLVRNMREELEESARKLSILLNSILACVVSMLLVVALVIGSNAFLLLWPMRLYEKSISEDRPLIPGGAQELRHLAEAYNEMYERNLDRAESLSFEAHNDALTAVLNRGAFNRLLTMHRSDSALILVDVDLFKSFNDEYGHDMGDAILVEVAATLYASFRSTDHVCRIGGDEFAVIATNMQPELRSTIAQKLDTIAELLRDTSNGLPAATVSVGVAFGQPGNTDEELFQEADRALYEAKRRGRDCYVFVDELD